LDAEAGAIAGGAMRAIEFAIPVDVDEPPGDAAAICVPAVGELAAGGGGAIAAFIRATRSCC
jgi:hypothetical protein